MGFFAWLGSLLDQLVSWLGTLVVAFLETLILAIQAVWYTAIASVLISVFGAGVVLYAIFLAGAIAGETLMEVWDPRYYDTKQSQVFSVRQAPQNSPLPTNRSQSKVVVLENWG
ncbi:MULTISPECIES: hypothetical protein [Nostocales]|jgi:hypothetical protein|uniref:Uncharacterized protein n=1 Tax=Aphanizomenon flos-aquae FACHB-1040 TaxID=2692887 RepID=A0ABR8BWY3_APHFL|nr:MULTISPECIES: hypothetical protein [Nostocales]ALB42144.1 hypothetical protein AA650_18295 [Anabaena sp. WA102]MBD2279192.1 hypothetical protein [Aphanizomenon flos-aquae FACHB-1040]